MLWSACHPTQLIDKDGLKGWPHELSTDRHRHLQTSTVNNRCHCLPLDTVSLELKVSHRVFTIPCTLYRVQILPNSPASSQPESLANVRTVLLYGSSHIFPEFSGTLILVFAMRNSPRTWGIIDILHIIPERQDGMYDGHWSRIHGYIWSALLRRWTAFIDCSRRYVSHPWRFPPLLMSTVHVRRRVPRCPKVSLFASS